MALLRTFLLALVASAAFLVPDAQAVVGGSDAPEGKYPYVAHVTINKAFGCTGTLVAPTWVVTAGHCSSLTGAVAATPIGTPGALIDVRLNSIRAHEGQGQAAAVKNVVVAPDYLFLNGDSNDVALLELAEPVDLPTVKIANGSERSLWTAGTLATIAGFGLTEDGGDPPAVLQEARVPITTDEYAAKAYSGFENETQLGAGYPEGGVDTCQGDSGGPLLVPGGGSYRLVGDTSYGEGCAQAGKPGIYGRVAGTKLREWIASVAPETVAGGSSAAAASSEDEGSSAGGVATKLRRSLLR